MIGEERELAFHYHDLGYLQLAPCTPFARNQSVSYTDGSKQIETDGIFLPHMTGQFVYLDGTWRKIHHVEDEHTATLTQPSPTTGQTSSPVVTMNEMWLRGEDISLTIFEVEYLSRIK